jgi:hypothetical protein
MKYSLTLALGILAYAIILIPHATAAYADIVCTNSGGCFETGLTIISNGSPYRGLAHKPRVNKSGKVVVPPIRRNFE